MSKQKFKQTITRRMKDDSRKFFKKYENQKTRSRYIHNYFSFIVYCRTEFNCRNKEQCAEHIQSYERYLEMQGYSPSTIHNRLVPVCLYHQVPLESINKPKRITADYTRGRTNNRNILANCDIENPRYRRSVDFQRRVGIRRNELKNLKGDDLIVDESGYICVRVKKGKGGKMQLQRILPEDVEFVSSYFKNIDPNEKIFKKNEIVSNNINYHFLRAMQAQKAYKYYLLKIEKGGDEYRKKLIAEIHNRAKIYRINKKTGKPIPISPKELKGYYFLRGANKKFALEHGLPIRYDKLAVMATSVFHLSHWRCDVTIASYLLAI